MNIRIPVTKARLPDPGKLQALQLRILDSGWLTNNGELVRTLESRLEKYLGVRNLVLVGNGTLALQVAYALLNMKGEVVTTPFSFIATASSIKWHGATPVFGDIDPDTLNLSPASIRKALTKETTGIVPVHVYGNPSDCDEIEAIARQENLKVVYDASHAFGVHDNSASVLSRGDISTLSFHATKLFHTIEGGALVISDDALCERARQMINFGFSEGEILGLGINAKMNEFEAAVGHCLLDDIEEIIQSRKDIHDCYVARLSSDVSRPQWASAYVRNYAYFPVLFPGERVLLDAMDALGALGVQPRRYFHPSLDTLDFLNPVEGSVSQDIASRVLCLPLYDGLALSDCEQIADVVNASL